MNEYINTPMGYLTLKQVLAIIPVSKSTWYRGMQDGSYPKQYKLAKRAVGWCAVEIRECHERIKNQNALGLMPSHPDSLPTTALRSDVFLNIERGYKQLEPFSSPDGQVAFQ